MFTSPIFAHIRVRLSRIAPMIALCILAMFASYPASAASNPQTTPNVSPDAVRTLSIHARKFEFVPAEITLTKGQTVKLEFTSNDVHHSLVVKALGINGDMEKGKVTEVVITPDQTGDFDGKCGHFCGIGHSKMHFVVHVVNP